MASGAHYEVQWHVTKHDAKDVADPSSMQDACHMTFIMGLTHHRVSVAQWKSIRARNPKVWGTIPHRDSEFFLVPRSWQDEKNIFLYFFTDLKFIIFFIIVLTIWIVKNIFSRHETMHFFLGLLRTVNRR